MLNEHEIEFTYRDYRNEPLTRKELDGVLRKLDMGIRYQDVIENAGGICRYLSRNLNVVWTQDLPCQG